MVDPTSDLVDDEDPPDCERCGDPAGGPGRRVVTSVEDGVVEYHHFCSPACTDDADDAGDVDDASDAGDADDASDATVADSDAGVDDAD
ncbi:MAG: hypothetical protein ABEJ79_09105 [Halolamina sp.]